MISPSFIGLFTGLSPLSTNFPKNIWIVLLLCIHMKWTWKVANPKVVVFPLQRTLAWGKITSRGLTTWYLHVSHMKAIIVLLYRMAFNVWVIGQFRCFFGKFVDNGDNPVNKPSIYNVEGNIRLSPGRQSMTTGSV
jgi:hypothetical protein